MDNKNIMHDKRVKMYSKLSLPFSLTSCVANILIGHSRTKPIVSVGPFVKALKLLQQFDGESCLPSVSPNSKSIIGQTSYLFFKFFSPVF